MFVQMLKISFSVNCPKIAFHPLPTHDVDSSPYMRPPITLNVCCAPKPAWQVSEIAFLKADKILSVNWWKSVCWWS